jgi:N-dimethylarginine dimethylaminohydrolase
MSKFNEYSTIKQVAIRSAANAFVSESILAEQWQTLRFHAKPDLAEAIREYEGFRALLSSTGAEIIELSSSDSLTIDSIYTRDSILVSPKG